MIAARHSLHVARYQVRSRLWSRPGLRIAILSDLHVCGRWMPLNKLAHIVAQTNALRPDMVALPGDFLVGHLVGKKPVPAADIAAVLARLRAPLGVFACLGNHDWADCPEARQNGFVSSSLEAAMARAGIHLLINKAAQLANGAYVVGLDSAIGHGTTFRPKPRHDPARAFDNVPDGASVILLAHEPDFFLDQEQPVALQISGHTHGGQIGDLGIWATQPSRYGAKLGYGLKQSEERNLIVSAGIGYGGLPIRAGRSSEIALVEMMPGLASQAGPAAAGTAPAPAPAQARARS